MSDDNGLVMVADRYRIHPDQPLPALDAPAGVRAYTATDERGSPKALFALVCRRDIAPRTEVLNSFARFNRLPLVTPLRWGVAYWPPEKARRFIIILHQPGGERIALGPDASFEPWREDRVVRLVLNPLMPVFKELGGRNLTHRAIRADNLYFTNGSRDAVMLGECFSLPPAMAQPSNYEPIDGAMAMPEGRGHGVPADDYYALGVLTLVLLCGGNPVPDMSEEAIVEAKISKGSYATLVGDTRLSLPMVELLRGLLCDDPEERWRHDDLQLWLNGRHLSPKQPMARTRASRPFSFEGKDYWNSRTLSSALGRHWDEARRAIAGEELITWVHRSVGDEKKAERLSLLLRGSQGGTSNEPRSDRQLARVLMALDPKAPLRLRELSASIDGLGSLLAVRYQDQAIRQLFAEVVGGKLVNSWFEAQPGMRPEYAVLKKGYEQLAFFISRQRIGFGLERCLYEENDYWPCLSPQLADAYVTRIEELLPALERLTANGIPEREPIDRHVAAFAVARSRGSLPERIVAAIGRDDDEVMRRLGAVYLLAELQRLAGPSDLPGLTAWVAQGMGAVIESYHSREIRQTLAQEMQAAVDSGDLYRLALALDDAKLRSQDQNGFAAACSEYAAVTRELSWVEQGGLTKPAFVFERAQQISAVAAGCLASVGLLLMTLFYIS